MESIFGQTRAVIKHYGAPIVWMDKEHLYGLIKKGNFFIKVFWGLEIKFKRRLRNYGVAGW